MTEQEIWDRSTPRRWEDGYWIVFNNEAHGIFDSAAAAGRCALEKYDDRNWRIVNSRAETVITRADHRRAMDELRMPIRPRFNAAFCACGQAMCDGRHTDEAEFARQSQETIDGR